MLGIKIIVSSTTCTSMAIHLTTEMTVNFPQKYQSPKEISWSGKYECTNYYSRCWKSN